MRVLAVLLFVVPYALAQFCGPDEIPDKLAINHQGEVALGCRYNECPRAFNDPGVKSDSAPKCGKRYYELSCGGPLQWVGGIPRGSNLNNVVPLQCCTAQKLRDSPNGEATKIVEPGQVFEGQVHYDKVGNVRGYDIIKNAQKIRVGEGKYALSVTVSRLMCSPKRAAQFDNVESAQQGFGEVVGEGTFQGPIGQEFGPGLGEQVGDFAAQAPFDFAQAPLDPGFAAQPFDAGFAAQPPLAAPGPQAGAFQGLGFGGAGAGGGGGGCFTGETIVETPSGPKAMNELKIGDQVLAVMSNNVMGFSPIKSFLHRLPEQEADFQRITAGGNTVTLTPQHFIYTTPCNQVTPTMKYARDVQVGQECLLRINGERLTPVPVESNEVVKETGVFNPMTEAGTIVADGFMASIHNVVDDTSFMNTLMESVQQVQKLFLGQGDEKQVELPWALQYAVNYASKLF